MFSTAEDIEHIGDPSLWDGIGIAAPVHFCRKAAGKCTAALVVAVNGDTWDLVCFPRLELGDMNLKLFYVRSARRHEIHLPRVCPYAHLLPSTIEIGNTLAL